MLYYNTCPNCGAHLDHGETCDCVKNTALVLAHKDGEAEQFKAADSENIIPRDGVSLQEFSDALTEMDDSGKVMVAAILRCGVDFKLTFRYGEDIFREAVRRLEPLGGDLYTRAADFIKAELLGGAAV